MHTRATAQNVQGGYLEVVSIVLAAVLDFPPNNSRYLIHIVGRKMDYIRSLRVLGRGTVASGMEELLINIKSITDGYQSRIGGARLAEIDQFSKHILQNQVCNMYRGRSGVHGAGRGFTMKRNI